MDFSGSPPVELAQPREPATRSLVERVRTGDLEAFEQIVRLHERRILAMAVQMGLSPVDAQDVCQEVFLRVYRSLSSFRADRNFEVWLWRIGVNVIYDALRKRRDRGEISWDWMYSEEGAFPTRRGGVQLALENADLCAKALTLLELLTPQERMVFVLRDLQDLDTGEVAKALGISAITVRRHGASARRKLRGALQELSGAPGRESR